MALNTLAETEEALSLSSYELVLVEELHQKLEHHRAKNKAQEEWYTGEHITEKLGIALPPKMSHLNAVLGWTSIIIDTLEERLDFYGYQDPTDLGLDTIFSDNSLDVESSMVSHDSLLYGSAFVVVGTGNEGEPTPLITVESPNTITGIYNKRTRRLDVAFSWDADDNTGSLYLPDETIQLYSLNGTYEVLGRDRHGLGRVPVVKFDNRIRSNSGEQHGQSEITQAVKYFTDAAARTALRSEVASEFYSAPREVILGGNRDLLTDDDGNPVSGWSSYMGRVRQVPWDENEDSKTNPQMLQLAQASPQPFIDQINLYATQLAAEAGLPVSYMGVVTNMPTSADAIKAGEIRLVKRAERRQKILGRSWLEVARLALLIRDGAVPEDFSRVSTSWMDASTPTRAATTDAVVKLVSAGILAPDSDVVADELNLTASQRLTLEEERVSNRASSMLSALLPSE